MATLADVDPLTQTFGQQRLRARQVTVAAATSLFTRLVRDPSDGPAEEWAAAFATLRPAYLNQTISSTDGFLETFLTTRGISPQGQPLEVDDLAAQIRPGVSHEQLAQRPIVQMRTALAEGANLQQARDRAVHRLESIVATDGQQAYRVASRERMVREPSIRSFRRVIASSEPCALCLVASTRRYNTSQLAPIHPGCHCVIAPVVGDAGSIVDRELLDEVQETLARDGVNYGSQVELANTRVKINIQSVDDVTEIPHGELGPLLSTRQHRNTEFSDLPPWVRRSRREFSPNGVQIRGAGAPTPPGRSLVRP